jgi:hypothetical protein
MNQDWARITGEATREDTEASGEDFDSSLLIRQKKALKGSKIHIS